MAHERQSRRNNIAQSATTGGYAPYSDPYIEPGQTNPRFAAEQSAWLSRKLSSLRGLRPFFEARRRAAHKSGKPLREANQQIAQAVAGLRNAGIVNTSAGLISVGFSADADDAELSIFATEKARECEAIIYKANEPGAEIVRVLLAVGIDPKSIKYADDSKPYNWRGRVTNQFWWLRQVRKVAARRAEQALRDIGAVSRASGAYVSNFTLSRWHSQQKRNRATLDGIEATNEEGQVYKLSELAELGQAKLENRRHELMVRMRGFQESADEFGHACTFVTVTCPSRFHATLGDQLNPKYNGATPAEASKYLNELWQRCRAAIARTKIYFYGFRIAEPHHDGCPHWHMVLFTHTAYIDKLEQVIRSYALQDTPDEPGAQKHRFTAVRIDNEKGTAAGYVAKYVAKNIDAAGIEFDHEAQDSAAHTAARVLAWASVWGIRQFQQLGGPQVTVYRELRRAARTPEKIPPGVPPALIDAADRGDWSAFTREMGGILATREERTARPFYANYSVRTFKAKTGKYGEPIRRVVGVVGKQFFVLSRWREWKISRPWKATATTAGKLRRQISPLIEAAFTPCGQHRAAPCTALAP